MPYRMVVGLGNPGPDYDGTRHNAGFLAIDALSKELGANYWKDEHGALVAHVTHDGEEILLVKPQSFMNTSGGPVSKLAAAHNIAPEEILVIHDDLDLEPGTIRIKVGGGHAGHNGLRSIHAKLGSNEYSRVRVGIGRPPGKKAVADFVLQRPKSKDAVDFDVAVNLAADAALHVLDEGPIKAMNRFN